VLIVVGRFVKWKRIAYVGFISALHAFSLSFTSGSFHFYYMIRACSMHAGKLVKDNLHAVFFVSLQKVRTFKCFLHSIIRKNVR